jgi:hypothetical protein
MQIGIVKHRQSGHFHCDLNYTTACRLDNDWSAGRQNFEGKIKAVLHRA